MPRTRVPSSERRLDSFAGRGLTASGPVSGGCRSRREPSSPSDLRRAKRWGNRDTPGALGSARGHRSGELQCGEVGCGGQWLATRDPTLESGWLAHKLAHQLRPDFQPPNTLQRRTSRWTPSHSEAGAPLPLTRRSARETSRRGARQPGCCRQAWTQGLNAVHRRCIGPMHAPCSAAAPSRVTEAAERARAKRGRRKPAANRLHEE